MRNIITWFILVNLCHQIVRYWIINNPIPQNLWLPRYIMRFYNERLTHWGCVAHICVSKIINIGSDNGLSPGRRQAIIWTDAGILLNGPWGTNFSEISNEINTFSFKKEHLKMSSGKLRPCCLGHNVLNIIPFITSEYSLLYGHVCKWFIMPGSVWLCAGLMCDLAAQLDWLIGIESRTDTNAIIVL